MEWFVKPETALRLGSSEAGRTGWEFSTPAATAVSVLEAQFSPFSPFGFLVDASAYEWASKHGHAVPLCRRLHAVQGW
jgi:hypothetical protein